MKDQPPTCAEVMAARLFARSRSYHSYHKGERGAGLSFFEGRGLSILNTSVLLVVFLLLLLLLLLLCVVRGLAVHWGSHGEFLTGGRNSFGAMSHNWTNHHQRPPGIWPTDDL